MEAIDTAFEKFSTFVDEDVPTYLDSLHSEADVRMKLIDPIFVDILGWPMADIHLEESDAAGSIDYRFTRGDLSRLIVEAKKKGRDLGINQQHAARFFKLDGAVFKTEASQEGIRQTIRYCAHRSTELACVTNGRQWFVFRGSRLGDGTDILKGVACVFGSLEAIRKEFRCFYDLLACESVSQNCYRAIFHEAEGQPVRSTAFRSPVRRPETRSYLSGDRLSSDLDRIMLSFFQDLAGQDDPEARRACFVTTKESDDAERNLARISEELRDRVKSLDTSDAIQITEAIERVRDMKRHEFVLLVGTKGSGKSTFVDRFFADVLSPRIAEYCVVVRVNLASCGCDASSIIEWLDSRFLDAAEKATFAGSYPLYEDLQGMFYGEYQRWRDGHAKHLYQTDKNTFKTQFGAYVESIRHDRPHDYIIKLLHLVVFNFKKIPCLVFDNADHFDVPFQQEVFKYAQSLYDQCLSLVIVPITDTTSWQLSKQGAMQSFYTDSYFLPTPPTELILRQRIEFIEAKVAEEKPEAGTGYFIGRGIPLDISNIRAFAACLQSLFLNTGQVAEWVGALANHDIRRSLQLTREIMASPHIQVGDLLKAYIGQSAMEVSIDRVKLAIVRMKYDIYPAGTSSFIQNVFDLTSGSDTTPLLATRALQLLESAWRRNPDDDGRYVSVHEVVDYLREMGIEPRATRSVLNAMLKTGLILGYDPRVDEVNDELRVELSPSGNLHLRWSRGDWVYLESMAMVTPLLDQTVFEDITANLQDGRPHRLRNAISSFIHYLLDEDSQYCSVPNHKLYRIQAEVTRKLEQQLEALRRPPEGSTPGRYARLAGQVVKWDSEKGFGFIRQANPGPDAFLHLRDMIGYDKDAVPVGALVEYETIVETKGPKAINAIVLSEVWALRKEKGSGF